MSVASRDTVRVRGAKPQLRTDGRGRPTLWTEQESWALMRRMIEAGDYPSHRRATRRPYLWRGAPTTWMEFRERWRMAENPSLPDPVKNTPRRYCGDGEPGRAVVAELAVGALEIRKKATTQKPPTPRPEQTFGQQQKHVYVMAAKFWDKNWSQRP